MKSKIILLAAIMLAGLGTADAQHPFVKILRHIVEGPPKPKPTWPHKLPGYMPPVSTPSVRQLPDMSSYFNRPSTSYSQSSFHSATDWDDYTGLRQLGYVTTETGNALHDFSLAKSSLLKEYGNDPFFKNNKTGDVIDRIWEIRRLKSLKYLSPDCKALNNASVKSAMKALNKEEKEWAEAGFSSYYDYSTKYHSRFRPTFFKKITDNEEYAAQLSEGIALLKEMGYIPGNLQPGYYDTDLLIENCLKDILKSEDYDRLPDFTDHTLSLLKQEKKEIAEIKNIIRKHTAMPLTKGVVIDKSTMDGIRSMLSDRTVLHQRRLTADLRARILGKYYNGIALRDNYSSAGAGEFLQDFYNNKTGTDMVGYYRLDNKAYYIYKNDNVKTKGIIVFEKENGVLKQVKDI
jgi:hypothetical protein